MIRLPCVENIKYIIFKNIKLLESLIDVNVNKTASPLFFHLSINKHESDQVSLYDTYTQILLKRELNFKDFPLD